MAVIRGQGPKRNGTGLTPDPELERLQTEVERLRNELFIARDELHRTRQTARADASARLVDALGHELRTSLTLMLGWTELLGAGSLPQDKHAQVLDSIYSAGWRIEAALRWLERVSDRRGPPNSSALSIFQPPDAAPSEAGGFSDTP
jgi:signal transduction histidine kinase